MNVQLVDATTGAQLWAERYDRPFTEIFAVQDDLVHKLAMTLKLQLSLLKQGSYIVKTTDNAEAYDYQLRAMAYWARRTKKDNLRARELSEKAITLDPQYAWAYAGIGFTYYMEWVMQWNSDPQTLERALEYGQKAVALDNSISPIHLLLAQVYARNGQLDRALSEIERAIMLAPNYANGHVVHAETLILAGRPTEALQSIQQAIRLSPPTPPSHYFFTLGWVYHVTERYAESIAALKQFLVWFPFNPFVYPSLAYNYTAQWIIQQSHDPNILDQAYDAAQNAIALNDALPWGHTSLGFVSLWQKHYDDAIAEFERAVALDENFVCGHMLLAGGLSQVGRVQEAVQVGERALNLKALPSDDRCLYGVASAYALAGRREEAVTLYLRMLKQFPNFLGPHLDLAALYSLLGQEAEAQAAAAEVLRLNPQFSLEVHKQRVPLKDPAMLERHIAALRKAGLK
jgi:tetratricopeptide (TPR) repeat protein